MDQTPPSYQAYADPDAIQACRTCPRYQWRKGCCPYESLARRCGCGALWVPRELVPPKPPPKMP